MPLGFHNDPDGSRYKAAYFEEFPTPVWTQGDVSSSTPSPLAYCFEIVNDELKITFFVFRKWIEFSSISGGVTVFGRSDGVLNPSGVRFGSAELYDVVEELKDLVEDCIAVGQKIEDGSDERVYVPSFFLCLLRSCESVAE